MSARSTATIKPYRPGTAEAERLLRTEPFISAQVLARVLRMSLNLIYRGIADGSVPAVRIGTKFRIPSASYRAMLPPDDNSDQPATEGS